MEFFRAMPAFSEKFKCLYEDIFRRLESELRRVAYLGPTGIDAFIYRSSNGSYRLKPIVEINPRYTMGRLTVELMKQAAPGCFGSFRLLNRAMIQSEGFDDFKAYAQHLGQNFPIRLEGDHVSRIRSGALCLNDPSQARVSLAVFQVANNLVEVTALYQAGDRSG